MLAGIRSQVEKQMKDLLKYMRNISCYIKNNSEEGTEYCLAYECRGSV